MSNVGEDVEKRKPSYTVGGNINWYSYCGKQHGGFSKNEFLGYDSKSTDRQVVQRQTKKLLHSTENSHFSQFQVLHCEF